MLQHYFVAENPLGKFHVTRTSKLGTIHGRFASKDAAISCAKKLQRNYLSSALDANGNPLSLDERVYLGVWFPREYEQALARGRAAHQVQQEVCA
jgi:hypothetical protein